MNDENIRSVVHKEEEYFYETSAVMNDGCDDTSSDSSFHSLCDELLDVSVEETFNFPKNSSRNEEFSKITPVTSTANITDNNPLCNDKRVNDINEQNSNHEINLNNNFLVSGEIDSNSLKDVETESTAILNEENIDPKCCDVDAISEDDDSYLNNIFCLDTVKAKDEECEVNLKDRDAELTEEDAERFKNEAVEIKKAGNGMFAMKQYKDAIPEYNKALALCPLAYAGDRAMMFHNRALAYDDIMEQKLALYSLTKAVDLNPKYLKALLRRARIQEQLENLDEALQDYKKVLELDPKHSIANEATRRLPPLIEERNEKLKTEMMGKLKDLGNMVLRPFGLSTDNFRMEQDPNTGGYNIKFSQNNS